MQLGRQDAGKGILLQWDASLHNLIVFPRQRDICADGDVRDVLQIQTAKHEQLIVITKNADSVQVIKATGKQG